MTTPIILPLPIQIVHIGEPPGGLGSNLGAPVPYHIWYIDPDNQTWDLSDRSMMNAVVPGAVDPTTGAVKYTGGYVCSAIAGIEGLQVMMQTVPLLDGTAIPNIYIPQTGTIGLAVLVGRPSTNDQYDYYDLLDRITRAFVTRRNEAPAPGYLVLRRPNGKYRKIAVYTTSGMNTPDVGQNDMTLYSLSLSTPDPYWVDTSGPLWNSSQYTTYTYTLPKSTGGILPINFQAAGVGLNFQGPDILGDAQVFNQGNALTYPIWTITGPGTPTIKNNTTNRTWALNFALAQGQVLQVNTARGNQGVVDITNPAAPVNMWSHIVFGGPHDLWPIIGGQNQINITVTGATSFSSVQLQYSQRWSRA